MTVPDFNWIANYIWGMADDMLLDAYGRGKYRGVIPAITVLRRRDAVLGPTKQVVLDMKASLDAAAVLNQDTALRQGAGQAFPYTANFKLCDLRARARRKRLRADFAVYRGGFSRTVQDIRDNFEVRNQIPWGTRNQVALRDRGWRVLVIWECEKNPAAVPAQILALLRRSGVASTRNDTSGSADRRKSPSSAGPRLS